LESDLAEEVLRLKAVMTRMFEGWVAVRAELPQISQRLTFGTGHRDKNAHKRAYRDLYSLIRKQLNRMPEKLPETALFEKPKLEVARAVARTVRGDAPLPFANQAGTIFMGCPYGKEWIDVTKVFTEHVFDGVYKCDAGHEVFFGGIDKKEARVELKQ